MRERLNSAVYIWVYSLLGGSVLALAFAAMLPFGSGSALQWLIDLCLPGGGPMPDMPMIEMERRSQLGTALAATLAVISAGLIYLGARRVAADPDKLLAVLSYMVNATPGMGTGELASAIVYTTGFALPPKDAAEALARYRGSIRHGDLDWIADGTTRAQARKTMAAALELHKTGRRRSPEAVKILAALAIALKIDGDELADLLKDEPARRRSNLPTLDDVMTWIVATLTTLGSRRPKHTGDPA